MAQYIFILGQASDLAKEELVKVLSQSSEKIELIGPNFVVGRSPKTAPELINTLGGTVKIAEFLTDNETPRTLTTARWRSWLEPTLSKIKKNNFGFSLYDAPRSIHDTLGKLALQLKKLLQADKYKARLVSSRAPDLSSVIVSKNQLLNKELIIVQHQGRWLWGLTRTVQNFSAYGQRDVGRPERDDRAGMLPPKVAQMMLNLAGPERTGRLLDPFCGSGTVLQEALLLGYRDIVGSDINPAAVSASERNLDWLKKRFDLNGNYSLILSDVRKLSARLPEQSVDLIVSEPFMGDARLVKRQKNIRQLADIRDGLAALYQTAFGQFYRLLTPRGQIIFIFPVFYVGDQTLTTLPKEKIEAIGFKMLAPRIKAQRPSANGNIIYSRAGQTVQREITLWQKTS